MKPFEKKRNKREGLYDPHNEHDSCGLGFIANIVLEKRKESLYFELFSIFGIKSWRKL